MSDTESLFLAGFDKHDGYLLGGFGRYGTDYKLRAVVSQIGLGAFTSQQTIFAMSSTDHSGQPLSGSTDYVMHMAKAPPVNEGWSLTVYDLQGFLIPNPIDRYKFSNKSRLTRNADGSVDIYLQADAADGPGAGQELAADRQRPGVRGDLAAARAEAWQDQGHPRRQGLAATGDHAGAVTSQPRSYSHAIPAMQEEAAALPPRETNPAGHG